MSENTKSNRKNPKLATLGVDDTLGAGDSSLVLDVLPQDLADLAFANMRKEVKWNTMFHRGGEVPRLVAVEGDVDTDGRYFSTSYVLRFECKVKLCLQFPDIQTSCRFFPSSAPIFTHRKQNPLTRSKRSPAPRQSRPDPTLSFRRGLHIGAFG